MTDSLLAQFRCAAAGVRVLREGLGRFLAALATPTSEQLRQRARALLLGLAMVAGAPSHVASAPSDCMGAAADGTAKCTAPLVSPQTYSVCIQTGLGYPTDALGRCYAKVAGAGAPVLTDGQTKAVIECLPPETYNNPSYPTPSITLSWAAPGQSLNTYCGSVTATQKYGVEMTGWAVVTAQQLNYGWDVLSGRQRTAECPRGYSSVGSDPQLPDYCVKPSCPSCEGTGGNALGIATGEKKIFESDFGAAGSSPLRFARSYGSLAHYRAVQVGGSQTPGFGDFWRHSYSHRVLPEGAGSALWATVLRPNGTEKHFRANGKEVLNIDGRAGDNLTAFGSGGWLYRAASGMLEVYASDGRLSSLTDSGGRSQVLTYSDGSTPAAIAPGPGLLIAVSDQFGRSLSFTYDMFSRLRTMTDPAGGIYQYTFDDRQMLTRVDFPGGSFRSYTYNESSLFATAGGPYAVSGVFDENGARYATYRYRDGYWNTPDSVEHGSGLEKYVRLPNGASVVSVTGPSGAATNYTVSGDSGVARVVSAAQPAGSGSASSTSVRVLDASGNVVSGDDFNGARRCSAFDPSTNLESSRVEGLPNTQDCGAVNAAGATLPTGSRKTSTAWHPDFQMPIKVSEPGRLTTKVHNGQPDPFASNAIASCAPSTALLPDGKPIAVLCKQVEQATTDTDGHLGMSAALQSGVANRAQSWTYNANGQVLTATDPLNNTTTYAYFTETTTNYTIGDLQSVTNAKGHVTTYTKYNRHGQLLESTDPNGVFTVNTYDLRQRLLTTSVGGQTTTYNYDPAGQLLRVTQPDSSYIGYEYDEAHRQKAVFDSKGNRIDYTLDNMGNKTAEAVKDPNGILARSVTRVFDALNRLQSTTGGTQ